jgi:hypothetical protein
MSGRLALGAILVGAGIAWLLSAAGVVDLSYRWAVGLLLLAIGIGLVLARGRSATLIVVGILVALAGIPALLAESKTFEGGVGRETERPTSRADLGPFRQAAGTLRVDLTAPDLDLDEATVEASIGYGRLLVVIPESVDITVDIEVAIGTAEALERTVRGVDVELAGVSSTSGRQELTLELDAGVGVVRVERR